MIAAKAWEKNTVQQLLQKTMSSRELNNSSVGLAITYSNDIFYKIKQRIIVVTSIFCIKKAIFFTYPIMFYKKMTIYKTLIQIVLIYGSEMWLLKTKDLKIMDASERYSIQ